MTLSSFLKMELALLAEKRSAKVLANNGTFITNNLKELYDHGILFL